MHSSQRAETVLAPSLTYSTTYGMQALRLSGRQTRKARIPGCRHLIGTKEKRTLSAALNGVISWQWLYQT